MTLVFLVGLHPYHDSLLLSVQSLSDLLFETVVTFGLVPMAYCYLYRYLDRPLLHHYPGQSFIFFLGLILHILARAGPSYSQLGWSFIFLHGPESHIFA